MAYGHLVEASMMAKQVLAAPEDYYGLLRTLILVIAGGVLGGLADFLLRTSYSPQILLDELNIEGRNYRYAALNSAWVGIAGAVAVQFIFVLVNTFKSTASVSDMMFLLSVSVAAGYSSKRLLPVVSKRLESQLESKLENIAQKKIDEVAAGLRPEIWYTRAMIGLMTDAPVSELKSCEEELAKLSRADPDGRAFVIAVGRLQRKLKRIDQAIVTLTAFIERKRANFKNDKDLADVLYNRACYYCIKAVEQGNNKELFQMAIKDIRDSLAISPENIEGVRTDSDFDPLEQLPEFGGWRPRPGSTQALDVER